MRPQDRRFTGAPATDARQRRLEQMTQAARDEARTAGARGAGLSDAPETTELGGRAQRLGAEKDAAADGRGGPRPDDRHRAE